MPICTYIMWRTFWLSPFIVLDAMLSDLNALSGRKPAVALVVIAGGKSK